MSDTSNEFDTTDENVQEPGKLRQLLQQAIADKKQLSKELESLKSEAAQRAAESTWNELKVPAKIRALYGGDKSPDAMKTWWNEYREVFNVDVAEQQETERQPSEEELARQRQAQQFQEASGLGDSGTQGGHSAALQKAAEIKAKGTGASQADLDALTELMGIPKF